MPGYVLNDPLKMVHRSTMYDEKQQAVKKQ